VPDRPNESASKQMKVKFVEVEDKRIVDEKFQQDPIW
jgi:hypothetical protein